MGTYMTHNLFHNLYINTFIFDLEYIGHTTELDKCFIWEIGVVHLQSNTKFKVTIDPGLRPLPKPFSSDFCHVTTELLKERKAVPFLVGWSMLTNWINTFGQPVLWISHNCFKGDKIVIESEMKRNNLKLPLNWFFFDSLIFCRLIRPKMLSYTLTDLYYTICMKPIQNAHDALADAESLMEILIQLGVDNIHGPIYPSYCTSLQVVKWLGPSCEKSLFGQNIKSLEQLKQLIITEYAVQSLTMTMNLRSFVLMKLTSYGIKQGNAMSITNSLVDRWI